MCFCLSRQLALSLCNAAAGLFVLLHGGCTDMYDDQKMKPLEESRFFSDHLSARPLVEGTVPRDHMLLDEHFYTGKVGGKLVERFPFPITAEILKRGRDRYDVFCSPCHGRLGDGLGMIVQRGFPKPNSFHADSVSAKPVGHYFDVITNGFGVMSSYADQIPVRDRWAIIAYVRALQLSQHATLQDVPEQERKKMETEQP